MLFELFVKNLYSYLYCLFIFIFTYLFPFISLDINDCVNKPELIELSITFPIATSHSKENMNGLDFRVYVVNPTYETEYTH